MNKTYKIELDLSENDIAILESQSKIANRLYNLLLEKVLEEREFYKEHQTQKSFNIFSKYDIRNLVPNIKQEQPIYNCLYSSVAKNVALHLSNGISSWNKALKRRAKNKTSDFVGFPNFRSYKNKGFYSLLYEDPFTGYKIFKDKINIILGFSFAKQKKIPIKVSFKLKKHIHFDLSKIKTFRITSKYNKYYANFTVELDSPEKKNAKHIIALDPNHKNLAVGYDSSGKITEFQNLYLTKIFEKRINRLKSKIDCCTKNSKRHTYLNKMKRNLYQAKREQTQVFLRTISNYLCRHYDLIAIGNYVPDALEHKEEDSFGETKRKKNINNVVVNNSYIGEFRTILKHICERSGKTYCKYDEKNTTKRCSSCKVIGDKLEPSIREWTCKSCDSHHIRDENAAQNGYELITRELPCSGHRELTISSRCTCKFDGRKLRSSEQEIKSTKANCISKSD